METYTRSNLPIGIQTFEDIRKNGLFYVDKTLYIARCLSTSLKYVFLSRPHRFGKSLFVSTLKAYFEGRKELFQGLYIEKAEEELARQEGREAWTSYPVLHFQLNGTDYSRESALERTLCNQIAFLEKTFGVKSEKATPPTRLASLIKALFEKTGKQVVVLIDEYDKPLLETFDNEERNQLFRTQLKSFYEVLKQSDQYIRFSFLTGITKFSKVMLFSGLNNLVDITLQGDFSAICGFTEEELSEHFVVAIERLAQKHDKSVAETRALLKKKYDGYLFSEYGESVYNPFSLLNVLTFSNYKYYWFETATPAFLVSYFKRINYFVPNLGEDICVSEAELQDFRIGALNPLPELFQAGYLTIKNYNPDEHLYYLRFPNEEVKYGFLQTLLMGYYPTAVLDAGVDIVQFRKAILRGDVETFMKRLESILAGIPYGTISDVVLPYHERDGQVAVFLVFTLLGYFMQTEVHNHIGRADAVLHTPEIIYVFEFKLSGTGTPEEALQQIEARGYATPYQASGKKVVKVGVVFNEDTKNIGAWEVRADD